jgi:hypothetical protein
MDQTIENWWQHGLSGEDRDEWCTALDTGAIDEDLLITLTDEQRRHWVDSDGSMNPDFQAAIAEECAKRLR